MGKALVAMSGGVDSSVAAALLLRRGYDVIGCFMRLGSPGDPLVESADMPSDANGSCATNGARIGHQGCCSITDAADARLVAAELGVPFYVCNFKHDFGRIMDYFVAEYAAGRTPNPCVRCNDWLKFGKLHNFALELGADFIASGHYARVDHRADGPQLLRGIDAAKDQSYVLFGAPRDRLSRMLLPIGEFEKTRVREMAMQFGLPVFDKPDSQEICFVPDRDYAAFVEQRAPGLRQSGTIVDIQGDVVGNHAGHHRFTIGQRRGIGVALGRPLYVVGKNPTTNTVTIGSENDLFCAGFEACDVNWLALEPTAPFRALVQFRAHGAPGLATVRCDLATGALSATFDERQRAVAPGQAAVCYSADEPDRVLGGGWITTTQTT